MSLVGRYRQLPYLGNRVRELVYLMSVIQLMRNWRVKWKCSYACSWGMFDKFDPCMWTLDFYEGQRKVDREPIVRNFQDEADFSASMDSMDDLWAKL